MYKGKKVAIKVQRQGLKELFDVDLKNLKKLAVLLDKFDPKTDGADRNWVAIYEESERLLYEEINYLNEADNAERFAKDFADVDYVKIPGVYREVSTPRVLVMGFVESFKLTDIKKVEALGLDKKLLAKRTADSFLRQIIETGYFHCDPHPGNLCVDTQGNLVFYDYGMMDELKPNVRSGFRKFCTALFAGGPMINDLDLAKNAKMLVDGVEEAGVLAKGADRLAVEKLARFFMRSFKDKQLGKTGSNIKSTVGTDLQTLTENNVFRFPSTFTFIFRSFASIDGIGKGLDPEYDIGKLAQPFVEKFTDSQKGYQTNASKNLSIFQKATGLNKNDIETAVSSPKKIAYIEETMREMESGNLKIRVRSLENEKLLERMQLTQGRMENIMVASLLLNVAGIASRPLISAVGLVGAAAFGFQAIMANAKIKKFDKTQAKFVQTKFIDDDE
jgi:predicted unusual protein kinase regulating ubiquinone biosynthesis (AarF/ABC1/UbiB family)